RPYLANRVTKALKIITSSKPKLSSTPLLSTTLSSMQKHFLIIINIHTENGPANSSVMLHYKYPFKNYNLFRFILYFKFQLILVNLSCYKAIRLHNLNYNKHQPNYSRCL